jgi:hypothetical protein
MIESTLNHHRQRTRQRSFGHRWLRENGAPAYYGNGERIMAQIVPIIRSNAAFDPETITILSTAFENAWHRIETSNSPAARPAYSGVMREVVARHIIDMAQSDEREPIKLSDGAVEFLAATYRD